MATVNYEEEARLQRQKINYFNSKVGNKDFDKAIDYLIIADWDEKKAVETYLNLNRKSNMPQKSSLPSLNKNINKNQQNPKKLAPISKKNLNTQPRQQNPPNTNYNINEIDVTDEFLKNSPYKSKDSTYYSDFIKYLQNKFFLAEKSFEGFLKTLKEHPGIILIVNVNKMEEFKRHATKIINNFIFPDINKITVLFPIMYDSIIGNKLAKQFSCYNFPSYIFCKYQSQKLIKVNGKMEGLFNLNLFIDNVLKGLPEAQSKLKASLKTSLRTSIIQNYNRNDKEDNDKDDNKNDNNDSNKNNVKDSIFGLSEGQVLDKREREFKELERQQEEKLRKEEEEKQKIIDEENRVKKLKEDYEKDAEMSKKLLPAEPDENNPDACKIVLRYPDGEKTIERRFLKTERVRVLYYFVKSKGREIFFEDESNDFDLIFGFPPKNLQNSKYNTLEEEGLFPNAYIQIREKE